MTDPTFETMKHLDTAQMKLRGFRFGYNHAKCGGAKDFRGANRRMSIFVLAAREGWDAFHSGLPCK